MRPKSVRTVSRTIHQFFQTVLWLGFHWTPGGHVGPTYYLWYWSEVSAAKNTASNTVELWCRLYQQQQHGFCFEKHWWCQELLQWYSMRLQEPFYNEQDRHKLRGWMIKLSQSRGSGCCHWNSDKVKISTCLCQQVLSLVIWQRARISDERGHTQLG